jgi:hypothetical protein
VSRAARLSCERFVEAGWLQVQAAGQGVGTICTDSQRESLDAVVSDSASKLCADRVAKQMQRELDGFEAWYKHTFSGRMLSWRHQHTSVTMTARFPGGNKEIGVSLFQATVLLQFNDVDTLNFEELLARTGIGKGNREILYLSVHAC